MRSLKSGALLGASAQNTRATRARVSSSKTREGDYFSKPGIVQVERKHAAYLGAGRGRARCLPR